MRIFLTGATGFVGSAIASDLLANGHTVLGLARSDEAVAKLEAAGVTPHRGALDDHDSLRRGADASDGVIHTAFIHDFARMAASGEVDHRAIDAIGDALAGSQRPFVVTSATGVLTPGGVRVESDEPIAGAGGHRTASEHATKALAARGVRAMLVRLPPSVHGDGDYGFVPGLIRAARQHGAAAYIGDGQHRWAAVHRLDAATVYRLAAERGTAGATYHAVADEGVPTRAIAEAIGRGAALPVRAITADEAPTYFGWLARFFALEVAASSARTRAALDWQPRRPDLLADLAHGRYFAA